MPPQFIAKSELLATPVEVPGLVTPMGAPGGTDMLATSERLLGQVNGILTNGVRLMEQFQALKGNAGRLSGGLAQAAPQPAQLPAAQPQPVIQSVEMPPPPQQNEPQRANAWDKKPETAPEEKKEGVIVPPKLNEAEAKACLAELMQTIAKAGDEQKKLSLGMVANAYLFLPGQKEEIEKLALPKLAAWLPRLVKP